jgi:hypothetical protein
MDRHAKCLGGFQPIVAVATLVLLYFTTGCKGWLQDNPTTGKPLRLSGMRMPPNSVACLVSVVKLNRNQGERFDRLWSELDQQAVGLVQRRVWDENGLRIALAPAQLPGELRLLLEEEPPVDQDEPEEPGELEKTIASAQDDQRNSTWRMTLREGEAKSIAVSPPQDAASWVIESGSTRTAGSGTQATAFMQLTAFPKGDGTIRMVLRPLIKHGDPQSRFGVLNNTLTLETAQTEVLLEQLRVEASLRPGQTLIATGIPQSTDFSRLLFGYPEQLESGERRVLLIRLVQTQQDDVFGHR